MAENRGFRVRIDGDQLFSRDAREVLDRAGNADGEIDRRVYELYGLTEEEISIVEGMN